MQETNPLGYTSTMTYDSVGNILATTDFTGRHTSNTYDANRQLTQEVWTDASNNPLNTLTYSYDADGNMLTAHNSAGTDTMTYDTLDRLASMAEAVGLTLTYGYDAAGNQTSTTDSQGGSVTSVYDAANRLTSRTQSATGQTSLRVDLTYNADSQLTGVSRTQGSTLQSTSSYTYDSMGNMLSVTNKNGSTQVGLYTYTYDLANRLTGETDYVNGTLTSQQSFAYDAINQLTNDVVTGSPGSTLTYTYDANGNRTGGSNVTGTGNELTSDGVWSYTYDANGNLTQKENVAGTQLWTYTYDLNGQMTGAMYSTNGGSGFSAAQQFTYTYDALANRISASSNTGGGTTTTQFATSGGNAYADLNGSGTVQTRYLAGDALDQLFAQSTSSSQAWYLTDRLGSVRDVLSTTGTVLDHLDYDPYGKIINETNSSAAARFGYNGSQRDTGTGLNYDRARYYDPTTSRWTSQDPMGLGIDSNAYRYVDNTPTAFSDPTGLQIRRIYPGRPTQPVVPAPVQPTSPPPPKSPPDNRWFNGYDWTWTNLFLVPPIFDYLSQSSESDRLKDRLNEVENKGKKGIDPVVGIDQQLENNKGKDLHAGDVETHFGPTQREAGPQAADVIGSRAPRIMGETGILIAGIVLPGPEDVLLSALISRFGYRIAFQGAKAGKKAIWKILGKTGKPLTEAQEKALLAEYQYLKKIRNSHLAGKKHPVTGIPFDAQGFPDFSSVSVKTVQIKQTGTRPADFTAANKAAGFTQTPEGFTWHHHQDGTTMQLVPTDIHRATGHTGGFALGNGG